MDSATPSPANGFYLSVEPFRSHLTAADKEQRGRQYVPNPQEQTPKGDNVVNTMRVIDESRAGSRTVHWAVRELLQNAVDHTGAAIELGHSDSVWYPVEGNPNIICVGRRRKAVITIAVDPDEGKLMICQFGRPLPLSALGQGTNDKIGKSTKGGFGDGFKSAMEILLCYHYTGRFEFYHFQPPGGGGRHHLVTWNFTSQEWSAGGGQKYFYAHLSCGLDRRHRVAGDVGGQAPVMVTTVQMPRYPTCDNPRRFEEWESIFEKLQHGAAEALGDFLMMYAPVLREDSAVYLTDDDRLVPHHKFVPLVEEFGEAVCVAVPPNAFVVFKGIFYETPDDALGPKTVCFLPDKGMKGDACVTWQRHQAVFRTHFRDVDPLGLAYRFTDQQHRFLTCPYPETRADAARVLTPLLKPAGAHDGGFVLLETPQGVPGALLATAKDAHMARMAAKVAIEIKRAVLVQSGDERAATAADDDIRDSPLVEATESAKAQYLLCLLKDPPARPIPIEDVNRVDTKMFPISTVFDLKFALADLGEPAGCDVLTGAYGELAKHMFGPKTIVYVSRADGRPAGCEPHPVRLAFKNLVVVGTAPAESADGLAQFMAEAAESVEEKTKLGALVSAFKDAAYEDPGRSFADTLARATRLSSGEEALTDEQRANIALNRLPPDARAALLATHAPPLPAPKPKPRPRTPDENGGDRNVRPRLDPPPRPTPPTPAPKPKPTPPAPKPKPSAPKPKPKPKPVPRPRRTAPAPRPTPPPEEQHVTIAPLLEQLRKQLDPPPKLALVQHWNEQDGLYTPDGQPAQGAEAGSVVARKREMDEALVLVGDLVPDARIERVRYSWSPDADWNGVHHGDGTIYLNLAIVPQEPERYIGLLVHEIAHDDGNGHDKEWGKAMQHGFEALIKALYPLLPAHGDQCETE